MEEDEAATAPARDGRGASPPAPSLALPMDRAILAGDTLAAARALVGATLVRDDATGRRAARIEEVEAYVGEDDRASHARFGRTRRNGVMWGTAGLAYVYLVYGMYDCLNVVTGREGFPAAVLVRAALPIEGTELMRAARIEHLLGRRRLDAAAVAAETARMRSLPGDRLARGPGVLAAAFGLDRTWTGADLCDPASPLRLEAARREGSAPGIVATRRVGIAYAGEPWVSVPWRFVAERDAHAPMNRHGDPAVGREEDPDPAAARDAGGAR